jgi:curli biogenesis system outer membrane secretion channel CsgG
MSHFSRRPLGIITIAMLLSLSNAASAQETRQGSTSDSATETSEENSLDLMKYPIAILPFKERGKDAADEIGQKVTDLTFAQLVVDPELHLVDREDLKQVLTEAELSLSGLTNPDTAIKIGNLTGAKLLVTGSVFQVDENIYVVGKIIGTETSRVVGASAKGPSDGDTAELVEKLGAEIIASIRKNAAQLVAEVVDRESRFSDLAKKLSKQKLPKIFVKIPEQHIGRTTFDPAAETEFVTILKQCGFEVFDAKRGKESDADLILSGEGISEYATRVNHLISVKSRLEIKLVERETGKIIASDRQTSLAVDLAENIAGKQALQNAAADIAERMLDEMASAK